MSATPDRTFADPQQMIAELQRELTECRAERDKALAERDKTQRRLAERTAERDEAFEQQTATAEVLQVINSSPGHLAPVFEAILEKALTLCDAARGQFAAFDGESFEFVALKGDARWLEQRPRGRLPPSRGLTWMRIVAGEPYVHILDALDTEAYRSGQEGARDAVVAGGRTFLTIALRREHTLLGALTVYRQEVRPFTDKQIALLQNFAAQAVIAMENARLITETREALEQQTATAEVLQVINSSPGDLAPVFDAMLEKAMRLCGAAFGFMTVIDGERSRTVAARGVPAAYAAFRERHPTPANAPISSRGRRGEPFIHTVDLKAERFYGEGDPQRRAIVDLGGARSLVAVPLMRDQAVLGAIQVYRTEVRPFSDKQIALLQNFADQAVIAMENARLITETQEALEQQTATAEVLQVINSSPGELQPVFEAILEKAHSRCGASYGSLQLYDGEKFHAVAVHGLSGPLADHLRQGYSPDPTNPVRRLLEGERFAHVPDLAKLDDPFARSVVELGGTRTLLWVALRRNEKVLGLIAAARLQVRPFSEKQIALLESFAAQAVIAMENARLITETREALEQQTATAEVLQVINSSPGDLTPVFDSMLEKAMHLCEAAFGILWTYDGEFIRVAAIRGATAAYSQFLTSAPYRPGLDNAHGRLLRGENFVHIADASADAAYWSDDPLRRATVELGGARSILAVPLLKDDEFRGDIVIYRREVQPFSDKQIALLQNFAGQAVIAMENARLITETREALDQQTATAEVLRVISGSATDLQPVFNAIIERSAKLCEAEFSAVARVEDGMLRLLAVSNLLPNEATAFHSLFPRPPTRGFVMGRAFVEARTVHVEDVLADPDYDPRTREVLQSLTGYRTFLGVPIQREGTPIGVIGCARRAVKPFTAAQIELVSTFADQAVIAIENARLFNDLRDRTDELAQRQAELRVTFDNMADGVVMFDQDLRLAAWNRNFQEVLDLSDEFLAEPRTYAEYVRYLAKRGEFGAMTDPEAELRRYTENSGRHYSFERTRPDGRVIEVRHNPVPSGGFVLIYSDITERKRSEAEIRAAKEGAEEASRTIELAYRELKAAQANLIQAEKMASLGQLTAGIAHEIKNPLNFVNNFAGLSVELLDELKKTAAPAITALDDDKRAEIDETIEMLTGNLEKIAEHGRRADNIVKSMLEHSRGSSGERRSVDLNGLIEEALNLAYHGARAQDQSFNITLERDYAAPIAPIELVPQDITRVCLNLFSNGFYATTKRQKEGSDLNFRPTLKVSTRDLGDAVEVRIRDNGIGIPAEIKDKLFQPLFTTKPTGEGTGLGLSISYDIVTQQHGGTITVDSRVGEFTEFTVRLPRTYRATMAEAAS